MKKLLIAVSLIAVCSAAPAFAHDENMNEGEMLENKASMMTNYMLMKEDRNRDGFISRAECDAARNRMFRKADANRDGALSGQELMDVNYDELRDMKDYARSSYKNRR